MTFEQHTKNWNEVFDDELATVADMCRAVGPEEDPKLWALWDKLKAEAKARS